MSINKITQQDVDNFNHPSLLEGLDVYQDFATSHANWPGRGTALGLSYIAGKLNGEAGEMAGQVFKSWRDDGLLPIKQTGGDGVRIGHDAFGRGA